jgi:flavin reductase (DIM6/NTAB) family NADH-FMN oxidoreductase RutF
MEIMTSDTAQEAISAAEYKLGMRRLVGSVCVLTGGADRGRVGLTATAVCSVSADPPTLLCCINQSSNSYSTIVGAGAFAVNVLAMSDLSLSSRVSSRLSSAEKFEQGDWLQGCSPMLGSALASFDCRVIHHIEAGTHGILLGQVQSLRVKDEAVSPLLYAQGQYGAFAFDQTS